METLDSRARAALADPSTYRASDPSSSQSDSRLLDLFEAQVQSRHLDFAARWLQKQGRGYYTIGSAGHEANAAIGLLTQVTDPALLHYRSGGFYAGRAARAGSQTAIRDVLLGMTAASADPISGGRHKVFGRADLHIIPQTSTIGSHLPRSVGLAFGLGLAAAVGKPTPWPDDAVVVSSFGDASANHSTTIGALNAAAYLTHRQMPVPLLLVCEDNGIGISTPSPQGWPEAMLRAQPGMRYVEADGAEPGTLLERVDEAVGYVRERRSPAILHLRTVRFMGHAGSDVESAYRSTHAVEADYGRDPLLHTARAVVAAGLATPEELAERYGRIGEDVMDQAAAVVDEDRLSTAEAVMAPLRYPAQSASTSGEAGDPIGKPLTLAQTINTTLREAMGEHPEALIFGEDVAKKGGVYGLTRGLQKEFGGHRVFDTLLDEQTVLGTALGTSLAGFLPIPEIQYLAYLHNAEDQLRGEAGSLAFFSNEQYRNPMVIRVAGLAYQRGFGGHFHNDNSLAVLGDIPGIVVAVASHPEQAGGVLRSCLDLAKNHGRVCVYVEPIALYHRRDLDEGDDRWTAQHTPGSVVPLGEVTVHGSGRDVVMVTFGNGVLMSRRVAARLAADGIDTSVIDLHWIRPLPLDALHGALTGARSILIVDETRDSGGVGESLVTALHDRSVSEATPLARVCSRDSYVPLGPAADTVLLDEAAIEGAARGLNAQAAG